MNRSTGTITAIVLVLGIIIVCICLVIAGGLGYFLVANRTAGPSLSTVTPVVIRPSEAVPPETTPEPAQTPAPGENASPQEIPPISPAPGAVSPDANLQILESDPVPTSDLYDLARRLQGKENLPTGTLPPPARPYQTGDQHSFWVSNGDTHKNFQVQATLRYITDHSYFWIENGISYDQNALKKLADTFENKIYPTDRAYFGSEWTPGIDGDPHLYILYARNLGSFVAGYFSYNDSINPAVQEFSNGHEMFVFSADGSVDFAANFTYGVLAHEFQHMIHFHEDINETRWLNEGLSNLAMVLNGYPIGLNDDSYAPNPDLQLNDWPVQEESSAPNYGAAFLFVKYFLDRFGEEAMKALVADQKIGLEGVDDTLKQIGATDPSTGKLITADDFFTDWAVTNFVQDGKVGDGRYTYQNYSPPPFKETETIRSCPVQNATRDVHQYGVDYIGIRCRGNYTLKFEGSIQTQIFPTQPHSGSYAFWSNKGDDSDMTLTQSFDFTNHTGPLTLSYWTWYDLEPDFDYVYLTASTDGQHWQFIKTPSGTDADITGANYGWGYNGESGRGSTPRWIQENVDLSPFNGKKVQLRFEYITDPGTNGEGFLLDDVSIPETGYTSDFEKDNGGWEAAGFVRLENTLPQTFRLTLITFGRETNVQEIPLSPDESGQVPIHIGGDVNEALLVVTGTTRFTRQPAAYRYSITP